VGLGLAIAQNILNEFKGEIGFESEYGKGSVFWFKLKVKINADKQN
jgi:signal transduction histidine kinase